MVTAKRLWKPRSEAIADPAITALMLLFPEDR
jgi:hypothetical protein